MLRRSFLTLGAGGAVAVALTGCGHNVFLTEKLFDDERYQEEISSLLVSQDDASFVVLTDRYHYVFATPPGFVQALKSPLHRVIVGDIGGLEVDASGVARVRCELRLDKSATAAELAQAESLGFRSGTLSVWLNGMRYDARGMQVPSSARLALNRTYRVSVHAKLSGPDKAVRVLATPVTVAADGAMVLVAAAGAVVLSPILLVLLPTIVGAAGR